MRGRIPSERYRSRQSIIVPVYAVSLVRLMVTYLLDYYCINDCVFGDKLKLSLGGCFQGLEGG